MEDFPFKQPPWELQKKLWLQTRHLKEHAAFWQQRTGKMKLGFDTAAWLYLQEIIDCLIVVAPNGVHRDWILEGIPAHLPDPLLSKTLGMFFQSNRASTKWHEAEIRAVLRHSGFTIFTLSYDAVMTQAGRDALWAIQKSKRCLFILDESKNIKTPGAKVSKRLLAAGCYSQYKRLLDGTPMDKPFDIYNQMKFLKDDFWIPFDLDGAALFRAHFGVWIQIERQDGQFYPQLVKLRNLDQLQEIIKPWSSRLLRSQLFDTPPKLYMRRSHELTKEQAKHYRDLKNDYMTWIGKKVKCPECKGKGELMEVCSVCNGDGEVGQGIIYADLAIVRMLRWQQICLGYMTNPSNEEEPVYIIEGKNPRFELQRELIDETDSQFIIWTRFRNDADLLVKQLLADGKKITRYDGAVSPDERQINKKKFQDGFHQGIVINEQVGSDGLDLPMAKSVFCYSQSFSFIKRSQKEDRVQGVRQKEAVPYIDLCATLDGKETVDHYMSKKLTTKENDAAFVLGDIPKQVMAPSLQELETL